MGSNNTKGSKINTWETGLTRTVVTKIENKLRSAPARLGNLEDIERLNGKKVIGQFEHGRMAINTDTLASRIYY